EMIVFDSTVFNTPQTITLAGTQLELSDTTGATTITGPAAGVTVSGNNASRVFQVDALVTASISGLTMTGGNTASYGNYGSVSGNTAEGGGGGVFNFLFCTVTLTNCTVSGNSTLHPGPFGGGGGVYNGSFSALTMTNCTVSGNVDNSSGGGVFNAVSSTATLT